MMTSKVRTVVQTRFKALLVGYVRLVVGLGSEVGWRGELNNATGSSLLVICETLVTDFWFTAK